MSAKQVSAQQIRDRIWICRRLASALQGESSILCALEAIAEEAPPKLRALARSMGKRIRGGTFIAAALREEEAPSFVWGAVQSGEARAAPAEALDEVADRLEFEQGVSPPANRELYAYSLALGRLGMLVRVGVPILTALESAAESVAGSQAADALLGARDGVRQGAELSDALERGAPGLPPMTAEMLRDGEQEGRLSEVLSVVADYLLDEAGEQPDRLRKQEVSNG